MEPLEIIKKKTTMEHVPSVIYPERTDEPFNEGWPHYEESLLRFIEPVIFKLHTFQANGSMRGFVFILKRLGPDILLICPISY